MRIDGFDKYDPENTLVDDVTWDIILEPALKNDPVPRKVWADCCCI